MGQIIVPWDKDAPEDTKVSNRKERRALGALMGAPVRFRGKKLGEILHTLRIEAERSGNRAKAHNYQMIDIFRDSVFKPPSSESTDTQTIKIPEA